MNEIVEVKSKNKGRVFSFGDPESVLDNRMLWGYQSVFRNGVFYEPPIAPKILGDMVNVAPHHRAAIGLKMKLLCRDFIPSKIFTGKDFRAWTYDYLVMANNYIEKVENQRGGLLRLQHSLAMNTRRGIEDGTYYWLDERGKPIERQKNAVFHLYEPDIAQEVYGTPEYLSAVNSALLNESGTLFRRKYYKNGSHAGFILYISDDTIADEDIDALEEKMQSTKGLGNFNNVLVHSPGGKENGLKLIPIAQVGAADEFLGIKNVTAKDMLTAHRTPPQLLGVMPEGNGNLGDVEKAANTFFHLEIEPIQQTLLELNDFIGEEVVKFRPYVPMFTPKTDPNPSSNN